MIAARNLQQLPDGSIERPRVVRRKPRPGDRHPISKKVLQRMLQIMPFEYTYGLTRVEMRAREDDLGDPFALYRPSERDIIIYSVPLVWHVSSRSWVTKSVGILDVAVNQEASGVTLTWQAVKDLEEWFLRLIFFHELGHHFAEQYRHKRSRIKGKRYSELSAWIKGGHIDRWLLRAIAKAREKT